MAWEHIACHINNFDHDPTLSGYRMMKHWQKSFDLPHRYFVKILPRFEELFKSYYWPNCGCIWKIQSFYTICSRKSRWLPWKLNQLCHVVNANNTSIYLRIFWSSISHALQKLIIKSWSIYMEKLISSLRIILSRISKTQQLHEKLPKYINKYFWLP